MRVGLIARADHRGLGIQTHELYEHMPVDEVLLVDARGPHGDFPMFPEWYPGATLARYDVNTHTLDETLVRDWLTTVDVVYSAETLYDWRLADWARAAGCATVVHANPEFFKHHVRRGDPHPTRWWNPTTWRMAHLPAGTVQMPYPVALEHFPARTRALDPKRVIALHVAGKPAAEDRNGTLIAIAAHTYFDPNVTLRITAQEPLRIPPNKLADIDMRVGSIDNYWDLYADADVLVLPRRYGGLCLPAQEAMAAGLIVVMSDAEPQRSYWPVHLADGTPVTMNLPTGMVSAINADPESVACYVNCVARGECEEQRALGRAWAEMHSWDVMRPRYLDALADACG
jgi:hypothetical protein